MDKKITDSIIYIGVDDKDIDLFESQYVVPNGVSYNSYVIMDDKIAIMDTADARVTDKWFANLREALGDRKPDYLVVSHLEPDHASNIQKVAETYPDMQIVGNAKTFNMMGQFFDIDLTDRKVVVAEGDKLSLGKHELTFVIARWGPRGMLRWYPWYAIAICSLESAVLAGIAQISGTL